MARYLIHLIKWFLHQRTGLTEIQRICYGDSAGARRTCNVERSLSFSKSINIQEAFNIFIVCNHGRNDKEVETAINNLVSTVLETKNIKTALHSQFIRSLHHCANQICGYQRLKYEVETLRATQFDESVHVGKLECLWAALMDVDIKPFIRKSKQWGDIGFQGDDPKTDLRGVGILGLENLLFFAKRFDNAARNILAHSHHPKYGYPMAVVSLNLTHMAIKLLNDGSAKTHMYNVTKEMLEDENPIEIRHFHYFYSYLFIEFDKFWLNHEPENVMQFNRIRDLFENNIITLLDDKRVCFNINLFAGRQKSLL